MRAARQPLAPVAHAAIPAQVIERQKILLLAGSFEARNVAQMLSAREVSYDIWISEMPRVAAPMPQGPQLHQFTCAEKMQAAIAQGRYSAIVDASHVFDRRVTQMGFDAARKLGVPFLRLERPAWDTAAHPRWCEAVDVAQASAMIGPRARVFCATGWDSLPDYSPFRGDTLFLRQTRRHTRSAPLPHVELVFGDPPFDAAHEQVLFARLGVDLLICRNLGGVASRPKLDAAVALDLDVILVARPEAPQGLPRVGRIEKAIEWLVQL